MKKLLLLLIFICSFCSAFAAPFTDTVGCVGSYTDLSGSLHTGTVWYYHSSDPSIATVDSLTGIVYGVSPGTVVISAPAAYDTITYSIPFHVYPALGPAIAGAGAVCSGTTTPLTIAASGGTWMSGDPSIATVDAAGIAGGGAGGTTSIVYMSSGACASHTVHVAGVHADSMVRYWSYHLCEGTVISLTPGSYSDTGGTWSSSAPSVATVEPNPGSLGLVGNVFGVGAGTATISYTLVRSSGIGCDDTHIYYRNVEVGATVIAPPITGRHTVCIGTNDTLMHAMSGGYWYGAGGSVSMPFSSSSFGTGAVAILTGMSAGTRIITYSFPISMCTTYDTFSVTVLPSDSSNTAYVWGPSSVCTGSTISLSSNIPGGSWFLSASYASIATVSTSGIVSGVGSGTAGPIAYNVYMPACGAYVYGTYSVTVNTSADAGTVSGPVSACFPASSLTYTSTQPGGVWYASGAVSVNASTGIASALSAGIGSVQYVMTASGCPADTATAAVTIDAPGVVGAISGATTVAVGHTITLSSTTTGGTWSVPAASAAVIDPVTGALTGVSTGTILATYTMTGCYEPSFVTYAVTITPADEISGTVYFAPTTYTGNIRVWLIAYSAPMLTAIDSVDIYSPGSSAAYQFLDKPAGTYRIKAAPLDGPATGTGFIPTYFTSSLYWNTADVVTHATGTVNAGNNINLMTGTITAGPGFIGGDVTTGANKGTTTGMPVDGMMMYLLDASNTLYQSTRTDAAGHYSFSNIPSGTYYVFPDSLNYATTPYTGITITSGSPSYPVASFIQHTLSKTITPIPVSISNVSTANASVVVFPNPSSGKVNIAWQVPAAQVADITVTDVTGRVVMISTLNMTTGAGSSDLKLGNLVSGLYTITVRSADINYTAKVQVQH